MQSHPMVPGWAPALYNQTRRRILVRVHLSAEAVDVAKRGAGVEGTFGYRLMSRSPGGDFEVEDSGWLDELAGGAGGAQWVDLLIRVPKALVRLDLFAAEGVVGAQYSLRIVEAGAVPARAGR